jgi:hypothetical protein
LEIMGNFRTVDVYKLGAEFSSPLRSLGDFYVRLLTYMPNPALMLHRVAKAMLQPNHPFNPDAPTRGVSG